MKTYAYIILTTVVIACFIFSYHIGKQSVLQKLASDKVEVLKDGKKVDAAVYAADNDTLICLLYPCDN